MTDDKGDDKQEHETGSMPIDARIVSTVVPRRWVDEMAPHTKWLIYASAFVIVFIGICFGISMLWTAKP